MADKKQERADLLRELFSDAWGSDAQGEMRQAPRNSAMLAGPLEGWLAGSKPFTAFAQEYQRKIAKKIRICRDVEESFNLYCELRSAYLLVQEPTFAVRYEALSKEQGRSADFAVHFRTNTPFHVEVTRLRLSQQEQLLSPDSTEEEWEALRRAEGRRLTDVVCDKLGQFSSTAPNLLWVWGEGQALATLEVAATLAALKRGMEERDSALMARHGYGKPADFVRAFQRLSALVVLPLAQSGALLPLWWTNNDARHPVPTKVSNRLRALMAADDSRPFLRG